MIKKESRVLWIAGLVGVITGLLLTFALTKLTTEEKERNKAVEHYERYLDAHMEKSDYPGKAAAIVSAYDFYKNRLNDYHGETREDLKFKVESSIQYYIDGPPFGNYKIPEELADYELVELLEELASEEFLLFHEQESIRSMIR